MHLLLAGLKLARKIIFGVGNSPIYTSFIAACVSKFSARRDLPLPALDLLLGALGAARLAYTSMVPGGEVATTHLLLSIPRHLLNVPGSFQGDVSDIPYKSERRKENKVPE